MAKETIDIKYILIPAPPGKEDGLPLPKIKGYQHIMLKQVKIDGVLYDRFEYIPDWIDLCCGGNAKRIRGNKVRILEKS